MVETPPSDGAARSRSRPIFRVVVVVVAALLVIVGLGAAGDIPGFHPFGSPTPGPKGPADYTITFDESGLPTGTSWSIALSGSSSSSTTTSIAFQESNGSYPYTVGTVSSYTVSPSHGTVVLSGAARSVSLTFSKNVTAVVPSRYPATFHEQGLAPGTSWTVRTTPVGTGSGPASNSSTSSDLSIALENGTYDFTVPRAGPDTPTPASGTFTVAGGPENLAIVFAPPPPSRYAVTFDASGLVAGTSWSIDLNGTIEHSTGGSIGFTEPNGSYSYTVGAVSGYTSSPTGGTATMIGHPISIPITFTPSSGSGNGTSDYPVTFVQSGLPGNITWGADLVAAGASAIHGVPPVVATFGQGPRFTMDLPNGTYGWEVNANFTYLEAAPGTFHATPSEGNLTVRGSGTTIAVRFTTPVATATNFTVTANEVGLPTTATWYGFVANQFLFEPAGTPIVVHAVNGSYAAEFFTSSSGYHSSPAFTTFWVNGSAVTLTVHFQYVLPVVFTGSGIGNSTWWVLINGTEYGAGGGQPVNNSFANGTYSYEIISLGFAASPSSGTFTVAGSPIAIAIGFTAEPVFDVTISASGIPSSVGWSVEFIEDTSSLFVNSTGSNGASASLWLPDGNYTWLLSSNNSTSGYFGSPTAGGLLVDGGPVSLSVNFTYAPSDSIVYFEEAAALSAGGGFGLPNGTLWSVTLGSSTVSSTGTYVAFAVPAGTYTYTVAAPAGFSVLPSGGSVTLNLTALQPAGVFVAFFLGNPPTPPGAGGVPGTVRGVSTAGPPSPSGPIGPSTGLPIGSGAVVARSADRTDAPPR